MSTLAAIAAGFRRALASPFLLAGLWLVNFVVALPAAVHVTATLHDEIGPTRVHERMREGFDMVWYGEYASRASGLGATFRPSLSGAGPFLDNLDGWITGKLFRNLPVLLALGAGYLLIRIFLLGGVVDRFVHHERRAGVRRFFGAGRALFLRFLRLAGLSAALYAIVYGIATWFFLRLEEWTRDVTVEGTIFVYSLLGWGAAAFVVLLIHMAFGYAKVATVAENRRSMLLAALHGLFFVLRHPARTFGQYYGVLAVSAGLLALYVVAGPGPGQTSYPEVYRAFFFSQLFLLARMYLRLSLLAGQTVVYAAHGGAPSARGEEVLENGRETVAQAAPAVTVGALAAGGGQADPGQDAHQP